MPRELSQAVTLVKDSRSFVYFDTLEFHPPFADGDIYPIVWRLSTGEISVFPSFDFDGLTHSAFNGSIGRSPTADESGDWIDQMIVATETGLAELKVVASTLIRALFDSAEYTTLSTNDPQFVTNLYAAYLGRIPDPAGRQFWLGEIVVNGRAATLDRFDTALELDNRLKSLIQPVDMVSDAREMGDLSFADGEAINGVELSLTNIDYKYSEFIGQPGRRLFPAPAIVSRSFKLPDGTYEAVIMLPGFAKFPTVDGDFAKVTVVSDLSRRNLDVTRPIPQHCDRVYRGPGCDSPDLTPTCSHLLTDAVNGCISKLPAPQLVGIIGLGNSASFSGLPEDLTISSSQTESLNPGNTEPSGWPTTYDPNDPRRRKMEQF